MSSGDGRRLGLPLKRITISDDFGFAKDASVLGWTDGFNFVQEGDGVRWRWTDVNAGLPSELWEGCRKHFTLTLHLAREGGPYRSWALSSDYVGSSRLSSAA